MQKRVMTVLMLRDAALTLSREPLPSRRRFASPQHEAQVSPHPEEVRRTVSKDAAPQHEAQVSPHPEEVRRTVSKDAALQDEAHVTKDAAPRDEAHVTKDAAPQDALRLLGVRPT